MTALESGDAWEARGQFERALRAGYPKAPGYRALADAYLALDHRLLNARQALERSLEADPSSIEDWMLLVEINLRLGGMDAENRAREAMREIMRRDPTYEGVYGKWRRLYLDRSDARKVETILRSQLEHSYDPEIAFYLIDLLCDVQAYDRALAELDRLDRQTEPAAHGGKKSYYRGVALTALGREEEGWRVYRQGIESARDVGDLTRHFEDLAPLLTTEEREAWPEWGIRRQQRFLLGWWNRRDPLPLTEVNERWVEQQRRMRFVLETFQFRKPIELEKLKSFGATGLGAPTLALRFDDRALDDRAEVYLRHGAPDMKANDWKTGMGDDECGYWYYRREGVPGGSFAVNFERPENREAGGAPDAASTPSLFVSNDCVFSLFPTTPMGLGHFAPGLGPIEAWEQPRIREEVAKDLTVALGTESFPYRTKDRLRLAVDPATFEAIDGRTELVLYFVVPVVSKEHMRYRKGLVLYDDDWNEVARATEEMNYALAGEGIGSGDASFVLDLFRVWLAPGTYRAAIQIDEQDSGGLGVWVETIEVEEPAVTGVGLSDLVLAADIATVGPARFMRYGHVVYAFPPRAFAREQPLHLYYEIYGLGVDRTGASAFRVDYTVRADHLDRSALGRVFGAIKGVVGMHDEPDGLTFSFERFGPAVKGGVWPEYLSIDPDELPPGQYTLEVEIIDHVNGDRMTHRAETFTIVR